MNLDEKFVKGRGQFVADISLPNTLYLNFVRSNYARARIVKVYGGITHKDVALKVSSVGEGGEGGFGSIAHPVLASNFVAYVGQPIAAVYAEDPYTSEDLIDSVQVDYEPLKAVVDPEKAIDFEPIHPGLKSNVVVDRYFGNDFEIDADIVVEDRFVNNRIATDPIEPRGIVCNYDGKRLTVWTSTQSVFSIRGGLSEVLGIPESDIHVIQTDTGGAFGLKGGMYPEYIVASYLAMKERRPVKWIETRREHLMASRPGRGVIGKIKLFADRKGYIQGLKGDVIVDNGAYSGGSGEFSSMFVARQLAGVYKIERAYVRARAVLTDKVPQGPYRGAGRPEAMFFIERIIDRLADELNMDPLALRLKNATTENYKSPLGYQIEPSRNFIEKAGEVLEYQKYYPRGNCGFSVGILYHATSGGESARIRVKDGKVTFWLGGNAHGQRHDVWGKMLIQEELGVDQSIIEFMNGDSDALESGIGTWGSRSAMVGGSALVMAARKLKKKVEEANGKYSTTALLSGEWDEYEYFDYDKTESSLCANLVTVNISDLPKIRVEKCRAYYDAGRVLDPVYAAGQNAGGSAEGIGQVLTESLSFNDEGQPLIASIADAGVLTADLLPRFEVKFYKSESTLPSRAKGIGEAPTIGVPTALSRAIERATGLRIRETPLSMEYLMKAIKN